MSEPYPEHDSTPTSRPYDTGQVANVVAAVREIHHPTQIGPYHILTPIGEGGMGIVYKAEQREPIHRIVAIKVIKLGMDTRQVIARFESERQALALMNHANVARVLDAGATDAGVPYFVMEHVSGEPINVYADRHRLTVEERLELMMQACAAVQHAHQKAIIHRDLKPTNILVTLQDDKPCVKVIDFGVAKAVSHRLTEKTLFTETGQLLGTPEYMAPEQAEAAGADVDTRSDVYSLGVVLYELLSGSLPFDSRSLRSGGFPGIQRMIREIDPPRPSTRLSSMKETLASVAAARRIDPTRLRTQLRGELDWIIMKAMEKDASLRYDSPSALSGDIQRFLSDEPVSAGPPSQLYRARKFMRRHRLALAMAGVLALVLTAGLVGTTWGFINARRQRDAAIDARNDAIAARNAEAEARELEQETDKFLVEIFTSIDPQKARGRDISVREILDQASRRIEATPPKHHLVESHLRFTFAKAYHALGSSEEAQRQLRRSLELDRGTDIEARRRQANIHDMLGLTYSHMGQHDQAESHFRRSVELYPAVKGAVRTDELIGRAHLAFSMLSRDELDEADELLSDVVAEMNRLGPTVDFEARVDVISKLAELRTQQGKYHEAEKIFRELLAEARTKGDDHPFVLQTLVALGELLRLQGRPREGLELQREAANLAPEVLGPEHPDTMVIFNNLALNLDAVGELDEAEKVYVMMLPRMRSKLGENHHNTLLFASNYGLLLQKKQKLDEAEAIFRQTAPRMDEALGPDHHDTLLIRSNLAWLRAQRGDLVESEAIYREVVRRAQEALGPNHPVTPYLGMRLGQVLSMAGKWAEAEPYLADADAFARAQAVPTRRAIAATAYGVCLANLKKSELALAKLLEANGLLGSLPQTDPKTVQTIASALAMTYEQMGNQDEAQKWRQASTSQPASGPTTRN